MITCSTQSCQLLGDWDKLLEPRTLQKQTVLTAGSHVHGCLTLLYFTMSQSDLLIPADFEVNIPNNTADLECWLRLDGLQEDITQTLVGEYAKLFWRVRHF